MTRRTVWIAIFFLVFTVFAVGAVWTIPTTVDVRPTFRVATFNIHKGAPRRGPYDLERTIDAIYRLGADLVGVQEAMRNDMAFGCDDQPALIAEGLRQRSGLPWTYVHARAWITTSTECMDSGKGDDVATEGLAFFSRERILESNVVRLNEGRVGLSVRLARLPEVPIVVTHLAANRQNQADRIRELGILLPWAKGFGPGILVGDLNAEADATELAPLFASYHDAWSDATALGTARGIANGATRPNGRSRIDYVLYASRDDLVVDSFEAVDTTTLGLGEVSDHNPVVATFRRVDRSVPVASEAHK
jgi:endonuclease/exonuclease/phosphatase family metal-dependent hydrolase